MNAGMLRILPCVSPLVWQLPWLGSVVLCLDKELSRMLANSPFAQIVKRVGFPKVLPFAFWFLICPVQTVFTFTPATQSREQWTPGSLPQLLQCLIVQAHCKHSTLQFSKCQWDSCVGLCPPALPGWVCWYSLCFSQTGAQRIHCPIYFKQDANQSDPTHIQQNKQVYFWLSKHCWCLWHWDISGNKSR